MPYIPNTDKDRMEMLAAIGIGSIDELFVDIPRGLAPKSLDLPPGKSEMEVKRHIESLASKNYSNLVCFLGGGFYDHYIPAAMDAILGRSEFYTSYTPYQAEVSQGTLQAIYEYQTAICRLVEMQVANASLYDGGTAFYEAAMMAVRITGRRKIMVCEGVNPIYRMMLRSYTQNLNLEFNEIPLKDGLTDRSEITDRLDHRTAAVLVQNPNFFGSVEDYEDIVEMAHSIGALCAISVYPISLGVLKTPGAMGADIVTGEGQSLGISLSFGGPYLGFMATKKEFVRRMPGRISGATKDSEGNRGFVLALQTREQHIRRDKATSNICTNEALCALAALAYLTLLGKEGFQEVAGLCASKASYARDRLCRIPGVSLFFDTPIFNEFTLKIPRDSGELIGELIDRGFAAGFPLGRYYPGMENAMLVAVTEKRSKEEIDRLAATLEALL